MRIHNPTITGSLALSGSSLTIDTTGTLSGSSTSTGSFGRLQVTRIGGVNRIDDDGGEIIIQSDDFKIKSENLQIQTTAGVDRFTIETTTSPFTDAEDGSAS